MSAPVLIVSGCSGVGKSTVSRLLTRSLEPCVHMPIDVLLGLFDDPFPDPASAGGAHRYAVVGAAAAAAAAQFASGDYVVILDGPMFPEGAHGVAGICAPRGIEVHYAVLRTDLDTCLERSRRRDASETADFESFKSLHSKFVDLDRHKGHAIDASGPAPQVASAVLAALTERRLLLPSTQSDRQGG